VAVVANLDGSGSTGNLTLDGILNVTDLGGFDGEGSHLLFTYDGSLTNNGLALGSGFLAGYNYTVDLGGGEVRLLVDFAGLQFWDGADMTADGTVDGGNGTWDAASTNWTSEAGTANASWGGLTGVFRGAAGTVEVDGTHTVTGLQFVTDGYVLEDGDANGGLVLAAGGADLRANAGVTATLDVDLAGTGLLTKTGAGTIVLSGDNSYSGGVAVMDGVLRAGSATGFVQNADYEINGGTLDLNGFDLTVSSLSGVGGTVDLGTATLTVDQDADTLYAGQITGTGGLHKSGAGTLALTGASTYTGTTEISGGVLRVDGSLASAVTVHAGALLAGKGTVGGLVVNGGTVSPGNSIGTLKVAGEVDFSGGGIFEVEVDAAGNSDRIEATGKA